MPSCAATPGGQSARPLLHEEAIDTEAGRLREGGERGDDGFCFQTSKIIEIKKV